MKITIVDYGMGNINSIIGALKYLKVETINVSNKPSDISSADKLILPGVGSFQMAMETINKLNILDLLKFEILEKNKPVLGICLGMQLLGMSSEENGFTKGFELIDGIVERFTNIDSKVPHIGFNQVEFNKKSKLYAGLENLSDFYFVHSYRMKSDFDIGQSTCMYGHKFISSFEVGNIAGVQFHPELSQKNGLKVLENYLKYF